MSNIESILRKAVKVILNIFLVMVLIVLLIIILGLSWYLYNKSIEIKSLDSETKLVKVESLLEKNQIYNVEEDTSFVIHFNSKIAPHRAVSIHTDSKCEMHSAVWQINEGFVVKDGIDVIIRPGSVLETRKRNDFKNYHMFLGNNWGNAPIYYLSINYDMESNEIKELEEPIIIPFTIKNAVRTPNVRVNIEDGLFKIEWQPVEGAVKYNIYSGTSIEGDDKSEYTISAPYTRAECAYVGERIKKIGTVYGKTTEFFDFGGNVHSEARKNALSGSVEKQNFKRLRTYYVTAVNIYGQESAFSMAIDSKLYKGNLPYKAVGIGSEPLEIESLPEVVKVEMLNGEEKEYPINYYRKSNQTYQYEIVGTKLSGKVKCVSSTNNYPDEINSSISLEDWVYPMKEFSNLPDNTVKSVIENGIPVIKYKDIDGSFVYYTDSPVVFFITDLVDNRERHYGVFKNGRNLTELFATNDPYYLTVPERYIEPVPEDTSGNFVSSGEDGFEGAK